MNVNELIDRLFKTSKGNTVYDEYYGKPIRKFFNEPGNREAATRGAGTLGMAGAGAGLGAAAGGPPGAAIGGTAGLLMGAGSEIMRRRRGEGEDARISNLTEDEALRRRLELRKNIQQAGGSFQAADQDIRPATAPRRGGSQLDAQAANDAFNRGTWDRATLSGKVNDSSMGQGEDTQDLLSIIGGSFDEQIAALAALGPIYDEMAATSQGQIGSFFDYAQGVAEGGKAPLAETYAGAKSNVEDIYGNLAGQLDALPQRQTDIAAAAGGAANAQGVAAEVAGVTAPFQAAGATANANAQADLTKRSAAGQDYLTQLASATQGESAIHKSAVAQANAQQKQLLAYKQAELEGAKTRALAEVAADIAGDTAARQGQAALGAALGLDLPAGVDPLDYLSGLRSLDSLGGGQEEKATPLGHDNLENAINFLGNAQQQVGQSQLGPLQNTDLTSIFQSIIDEIDAQYLPGDEFDQTGAPISKQKLLGLSLDELENFLDPASGQRAQGPERDALATALRIYYGG